jgi:hypothetical protein
MIRLDDRDRRHLLKLKDDNRFELRELQLS